MTQIYYIHTSADKPRRQDLPLHECDSLLILFYMPDIFLTANKLNVNLLDPFRADRSAEMLLLDSWHPV